MWQYVFKRCAYSVFILLGVLILTFFMFRIAAGDPSGILLGKNPTPQDVENLRQSLGVDKPLFWGNWKQTECFSSAKFENKRVNFPGITYDGEPQVGEKDYKLNAGNAILFHRNFPLENEKIRMVIHCSQNILVNGTEISPDQNETVEMILEEIPEQIRISLPADTAEEVKVYGVSFYRPTSHFWDSQLLASLKEIVSFSSTFPYCHFFNFGNTLQTREPIREKLWHGMWPSLFLMLPIFLGELLLGILFAMISCAYRSQFIDRFIVVLSVAGMSISYLALIIFGQWFLGYYLNLFPVWGWGDIRHLLLPIAIGIVSGTGSGVRFYRTVFLNEMNREYLRTAKAKGLSSFILYFKHLLKNAMVPIITRASTTLPFLFTGSLLLESFFGIPGLGYEGINALHDSDLQLLKALVLLGAFLFILINLLTDIAYAYVDPRMRIKK